MNLIELAENLKDVPDQFLLKEVQAPSGAYPAYMVVSELTRRKRMRESAQKQAPDTTVAEDLVGEQERAQAMAQMQQAQQAQPMIPPQDGLNAQAGLGALPQAQGSLAAQDAMGTTPPEMMMPTQNMAGGGMVSFKEGGDVQRFQVGGQPLLRSDLERADSSFFPRIGYSDSDLFIDPITKQKVTYEQYLALNAERQKQSELMRQAEIQRRAEAGSPVQSAAVAPVAAATGAFDMGGAPNVMSANAPESVPVASPASPAFAMPQTTSPFMTQQQDLLTRFRGMKEPTAAELAASRQAGRSEFESSVPFRFGFMEDQIKSDAAKLRGREGSNINEALMQAGLGIMGSKSPRFLQAVSEGGLSALRAYKEGQKDIREGERALMQSRGEYAKAQTLYDQGKYSAGEKAEQRGLDAFKRGQERLNTESAILARLGTQESALQKQAMDQAKLPYDIAESQARAKYYEARPASLADKTIATPDQISAARNQALMTLPKGATQAQIEAQLDAVLAQSGLRRATAPATTSPLNRGTL